MDHIGIVIARAKKYEMLLAKHWGAVGKGLHEKVGSLDSKLSPSLVKHLKHFAYLRNQFAHHLETNSIKDEAYFVQLTNRIERSFARAIKGYEADLISESELNPIALPPQERIVYTASPPVRESVYISTIPESLLYGTLLVFAAILLAIFQGGFVEAKPYVGYEKVERWWWFWDGTRKVTKARTEWNFSMFPLVLGLTMMLFGTAKWFLNQKPDNKVSSQEPDETNDNLPAGTASGTQN